VFYSACDPSRHCPDSAGLKPRSVTRVVSSHSPLSVAGIFYRMEPGLAFSHIIKPEYINSIVVYQAGKTTIPSASVQSSIACNYGWVISTYSFLARPAECSSTKSISLSVNPLSPCTRYHLRSEDSTLLVSTCQPFFPLFSVRHAPFPREAPNP
jgi:hypothetical protein